MPQHCPRNGYPSHLSRSCISKKKTSSHRAYLQATALRQGTTLPQPQNLTVAPLSWRGPSHLCARRLEDSSHQQLFSSTPTRILNLELVPTPVVSFGQVPRHLVHPCARHQVLNARAGKTPSYVRLLPLRSARLVAPRP